jgi:hypothetical protein
MVSCGAARLRRIKELGAISRSSCSRREALGRNDPAEGFSLSRTDAGLQPSVQINIDATAVAYAFNGVVRATSSASLRISTSARGGSLESAGAGDPPRQAARRYRKPEDETLLALNPLGGGRAPEVRVPAHHTAGEPAAKGCRGSSAEDTDHANPGCPHRSSLPELACSARDP